jgi:ABC-type ATPase involved in cell division/GNAT superfamily N-acetyltransferase
MTNFHVTVECPLFDSFRVQQVAGMFDVPLAEKMRESFQVEIPDASQPWSIGLIVGPSGSGKSTVARACYKDALHAPGNWPSDRAVIDALERLPIREATRLFTAVGFSSPPSWVKPYHVLSGGERFRCDLARALAGTASDVVSPPAGTTNVDDHQPPASDQPVVAFDEFTSVVDRQVAKATSAAIAKGIRKGHIGCRFVAISCHYDVAPWLQPDWMLDMATGELEWFDVENGNGPGGSLPVASPIGPTTGGRSSRRRLRRPAISIQVRRCHRRVWRRFARHHYLSGSLAPTARCYVAIWNEPAREAGDGRLEEPGGSRPSGLSTAASPPCTADSREVAFCATLPIIGRQGHWRFTRIVTLPDYQGLGLGMRMVEGIAGRYRDDGLRISVTTSHPAMIEHSRRSARWRVTKVKKAGGGGLPRPGLPARIGYRDAASRCVVSMEYIGRGAASANPKPGVPST